MARSDATVQDQLSEAEKGCPDEPLLSQEKPPGSNDLSDATLKRRGTQGSVPKVLSRLELAADQYENDIISNEELCDPEQVPLLAVVGWEGDGGESASLSNSYLTLWNVSSGSAFLRLKTPALQVLLLEWYEPQR